MLYMLGGVVIDTAPLSVEGATRASSADIAAKPVIGAVKAHEFMGEGDATLTLTGQVLPMHIGGEAQLAALHAMCVAGERFNVLRGDGVSMGHHALTAVSEGHTQLSPDGVGYVVAHTLSLIKVEHSRAGGEGTIARILSIFDALR